MRHLLLLASCTLLIGMIVSLTAVTHLAPFPHCWGTGVSKNAAGTPSFSWLHVAGGSIVDERNCPVRLMGFNTMGLEFGNAIADITATRLKTFTQTYQMNLWRLVISPVWWNANDYVPAAQMTYQDWVKQVIAWMEQNGNYVEIDPTAYHTIGPAASGPYCDQNNNAPPCWTSQDTPNNPPWTEQQVITAAQQFWQSIVPLYKNDPAILYDGLNEPVPPDFTNYHEDLSLMIDTIQSLNPRAVVFVYGSGIDQMVAGTVADYPQQNLVMTFHPYPDPNNPWQGKLARIQGWIPWIHGHNHAVSIEEWGDPQLASNVAYAEAVVALVKTYGAATTYYAENATMTGDGHLTSIGQVVQQVYGGPPAQPIATPAPTPTSTPPPTPSGLIT
jgi:hypothetical protein